jgi:hypothetical protein
LACWLTGNGINASPFKQSSPELPLSSQKKVLVRALLPECREGLHNDRYRGGVVRETTPTQLSSTVNPLLLILTQALAGHRGIEPL